MRRETVIPLIAGVGVAILLALRERPLTALLIGAAAAIVASALPGGLFHVARRPWRIALMTWAVCVIATAALGVFLAQATDASERDLPFISESFVRMGALAGVLLAIVPLAAGGIWKSTGTPTEPAERGGGSWRSALLAAVGVEAAAMLGMVMLVAYGAVFNGPTLQSELPSMIKEALAMGFWVGLLPAIIIAIVRPPVRAEQRY